MIFFSWYLKKKQKLSLSFMQVLKANCGSTLMLRMPGRRICVLNCAGLWRVLNTLILWSLTPPSGWWSLMTASRSGEHIRNTKALSWLHWRKYDWVYYCMVLFSGSRINISSSTPSWSTQFTSDMKIPRLPLILWYWASHLIKIVLNLPCSNSTAFCDSALADSPQQTVPFPQTLVCDALLRTEEPSGSHQTRKTQCV